jgi:cell division protein FtsL
MAKRRVNRKGRVQVAMALGFFLLIAMVMVWRKSYGFSRSVEIRALDRQRVELESERAKLVNDIASMVSIGRMGAVAGTRLGMKLPDPSMVLTLPRPLPREER